MSFDSWEKLSRAQRDYPKPKLALAVVEKAKKKNPGNFYIAAWYADIALQLHKEPNTINTCLLNAFVTYLPAKPDLRLLAYYYKLFATTLRRAYRTSPPTVSSHVIAVWDHAASVTTRRSEKLAVWNALFRAAVASTCWGDARHALVKYSQEYGGEKKKLHYINICITQLSSRQYGFSLLDLQAAKTSAIQAGVAHRLMKSAYNASVDDPVRVQDIRDLRFMAEIYRRTGLSKELCLSWDSPPLGLKRVMAMHHSDLMSVRRTILKDQDDQMLEEYCLQTINETIAQLEITHGSQALRDLCAWNREVWNDLLQSWMRLPSEKRKERTREMMKKCFGQQFNAKDRPLHYQYLNLCFYAQQPLLEPLKDYWRCHFQLATCFSDLRAFIFSLPHNQKIELLKYISEETKIIAEKLIDGKADFAQWKAAEGVLLQVSSLVKLTSLTSPILPEVFEDIFTRAIKLRCISTEDAAISVVAVYTLLRLHSRCICPNEDLNPFDWVVNSRILLQATMLARHLVALDKSKSNRAMAILAARLHLNLGLGKSAFQLYRYARCKEMLHVTISPFMLSRISMTHPFAVNGYQGFDAVEELEKVNDAIDKMIEKVDKFIITDVEDFLWDQANDLLGFKQRLVEGTTRAACWIERRRIARLKGESPDRIPIPIFEGLVTMINDDTSIFPSAGHFSPVAPMHLIMPNQVPTNAWIMDTFKEWDYSSRILHGEDPGKDKELEKHKAGPPAGISDDEIYTMVEMGIRPLWHHITIATQQLFEDVKKPDLKKAFYPDEFLLKIKGTRSQIEKQRLPTSTGLRPEDETTLFHENMLMFCYTRLEALRATNRLVEHFREKVVNPKSKHLAKGQLTKKYVDELAEETKYCFTAIQDVANSYITVLKKTGEKAIKAQVRWGVTGNAMKELLSDDDVEFYAKEYVDSALEGWNGVLKVKLR